MHILLLQLIIDPACSIVFEMEAEEGDLMRKPPRSSHAALFSREQLLFSVLQGALFLAILCAAFAVSLHYQADANAARTITFLGLVLANIGLIFSSRSSVRSLWGSLQRPNRAVWWIALSALTVLLLVLFTPWLRGRFYFVIPDREGWMLALATGVLSAVAFEFTKYWRARLHRRRAN